MEFEFFPSHPIPFKSDIDINIEIPFEIAHRPQSKRQFFTLQRLLLLSLDHLISRSMTKLVLWH